VIDCWRGGWAAGWTGELLAAGVRVQDDGEEAGRLLAMGWGLGGVLR